MLEMYKKFKDLWIVELLFDDLLAWNDWCVPSVTMTSLAPPHSYDRDDDRLAPGSLRSGCWVRWGS